MVGLWRSRGLLASLLFPASILFRLVVSVRRRLYRQGLLAAERLPVPVVVIGNLVAGGAGKTPLTLWLAQRLRAAGRQPGIISRGYGRHGSGLQKVGPGATAAEVGDEPLLLARRSGCPVVVGEDRAAAARQLLQAHPECDVILCDDGLQHYRLARDLEIAVVDRRGFMNGWLLPAGPLREPVSRLNDVAAVVLNAVELDTGSVPPFRMRIEGKTFYRLDAPAEHCGPDALRGLRMHALAGIGEPQRFFDHLAALGLECQTHAFPDHHVYARDDMPLEGDALLMTEKDALKCAGLSDLPVWVLPVDAVLEPDLASFVLEKLDGCPPA